VKKKEKYDYLAGGKKVIRYETSGTTKGGQEKLGLRRETADCANHGLGETEVIGGPKNKRATHSGGEGENQAFRGANKKK